MIRFDCDYCEGAHPSILQKLAETNLEQTPGYGVDDYCEAARGLILAACGLKKGEADVHFLVGGTQTNLTVLSAALRPHQGALCADTGHINAHETGAIEATGHKVLALPAKDGKITAAQIDEAWRLQHDDGSFEHIVQPKLVYLSQSTEVGTLYTHAELAEISRVCRERGLLLYLDGARLGYALEAEGNDLDLPAIAALCDAFYIGGTKQGALFGEALVLRHPALREDFRYLIKQKGGMLAKGRLLGIQFQALFEDGLYFRLARHADALALRIRQACADSGLPFLQESPSNQQFPILPNGLLTRLQEKYAFSVWGKVDEAHTAVRICTSWATREEDVDALIRDLLGK